MKDEKLESRKRAARAGQWASVLCSLLLARTGLAANAPAGNAPASGPVLEVTCAYSNPGYSGWCRQTQGVPAGGSGARVCAGVLHCLNDVRCTKTYCTATGIRGNWRLEKIVTRTRPAVTRVPGS